MACKIIRTSLTDEQVATIRTLLYMIPEKPFIPNKNRFSTEDNVNPIQFYLLEKEFIHLPLLFAASLLQIIPNNHEYPQANIEFTGNLREHQVAVAKEALEQLNKYGTTTLGLYPGFGKTILGAELASRKKLLPLILVHREILAEQWRKTFETFTNARIWVVGEKNPPKVCEVIICMNTRWEQIPSELRDAVGLLIIDEAHCFCTPSNVNCLLAFHPKYVVIETATLERDDGMESMIQAIAGSHGIFRESHKPFTVVKVNTNIKPERKLNKMGGTDYISLLKDTLLNPRRNDMIIELIKVNLNKKILVMSVLVEHVMLIYERLIELKISCDYLCGSKKSYQDSNVLCTNISKTGTGFDPSTSCATFQGVHFDLLILVTSIKKIGLLTQTIGRIFRADYPTVFHLVDGDSIFQSHWNKARRWYNLRGGSIREHTFPEEVKVDTKQLWLQEKLKELKQLNK